jgi:hypothetical protein
MITKEKFIKYIDKIKRCWDFSLAFDKTLREYDVDGYIAFPDCTSALVDVLSDVLGDKSDWISYYCWELEFGRNWSKGMITDKDGNDIKLETAEDLWEVLHLE